MNTRRKRAAKVNALKAFFLTLLALGGILIGFALIHNYSLMFFGGFALVFWGSIMAFISGERLIKKEVLDATSLTYLAQLDKIGSQIELQNMVYASPSSLNSQAFLKSPSQQIQNVELNFVTSESVNFAPENELFHLMERKLGKSFSGIAFLEVKAVLLKLLVESLELAQSVDVEANGDTIIVIVDNPYDLQIYLEAEKQNNLSGDVGFPLSGAIAYALANSSGRSVLIKQHMILQDRKTVQIEYTLLGQRSGSA